jgi:phage terminase large subunit-like protein
MQDEGGIPMVEFRARTANFSEPTKRLAELILTKRIHHCGNPVLTWCLSNVACRPDARNNVYPRKQSEGERIDAAIAVIMALARALFGGGTTSVYDDAEDRPGGLLIV